MDDQFVSRYRETEKPGIKVRDLNVRPNKGNRHTILILACVRGHCYISLPVAIPAPQCASHRGQKLRYHSRESTSPVLRSKLSKQLVQGSVHIRIPNTSCSPLVLHVVDSLVLSWVTFHGRYKISKAPVRVSMLHKQIGGIAKKVHSFFMVILVAK